MTQNDNRAEAERLFNEGMQLYQQQTAESYRQAIAQWKQAFSLIQTLGDKSLQEQALTSAWIGRVYDALGEKQQALDYYEQALPLWRAVGVRGGEARTLNNIGSVYNDLGEKQQALDYYEQSLPL